MSGFQTAFLSVKFLTHADSPNVRRTGAHLPSEHSSHGHKFTPELNLSSKIPFVLPDKTRGLHSAVELHQDHTHNPKSAKAFLPPRAVSWLQRDQKQEPAVFSYHHCTTATAGISTATAGAAGGGAPQSSKPTSADGAVSHVARLAGTAVSLDGVGADGVFVTVVLSAATVVMLCGVGENKRRVFTRGTAGLAAEVRRNSATRTAVTSQAW